MGVPLNVGNYGRLNGPIGDKKKISDSVYLAEDDVTTLHEFAEMGVEVIHQALPEVDRVDLMTRV